MKLTLEQQEVKRLYIEGKTAAEIIKKLEYQNQKFIVGLKMKVWILKQVKN